jgi:VWFA-related protein
MVNPSRRLSNCLILALLPTLSLAGSDQNPQMLPAARHIRVQTGEVVVDVNVTDSSGRPVRGLAASDFEVYEDSIKQQIVSFRSISGNALEPSPQSGSANNQASNLLADTPAYPHLTSLVFDKVNVAHADAVRAAEAAKTYVDKFLRGNDLVAVFGISLGVQVYQRFTSDRALLLKAIQAAVSGNTRRSGDVADEIRASLASLPGGGAFIPGVFTDEDKIQLAESADADMLIKFPELLELRILLKFRDIDQAIRGDRSMAGLLSIIEGQRVNPGRKSLIFLSSGFAVSLTAGQYAGGAAEFRAITGAANRAGVTIYSIDVSGLRDQDPEADRQAAQKAAANSRVTVGPRTSVGLLSAAMGSNTLDTLKMLADETGGYTVANTSDLVDGMERIGSYLEEYCVITYMPSNLIMDGKFRAISVKLKRPRLNVRARRGYYAFSDSDRLPLMGFEAELLDPLNAKSPPSAFPIYVGGYCFPGNDATPTAALFVQFPLSKFKFEKRRDTRDYQSQADVMLLVKRTDGSIVHRLSRQYDLEASQELMETTRQKDFSFYRRVPLAPDNYVLEAVVRDRRTGSASVKKTEFHVASSNQDELMLSSVVLGKEPVLMAKRDAGENPFGLADPLFVAGTTILPDVSGVCLKSSDTELVVYFAAQSRKASAPILCTLQFTRDGTPDLELHRSLMDSAGRAIPCVVKVGLDQLKLGKYELRVTATSANQSASSTAQFRVER